MTPFTIAGWLVCGLLGLLLVFQLRNTRELSFPGRGRRESWPSLSILIVARGHTVLHDVVASVAQQDYDGELEILVLVDPADSDTIGTVERLAIAQPHIRTIDADRRDLSPAAGWQMLDRAARSDDRLYVGKDLVLDPGAAAAVVGHAVDWNLATAVLTPRVSPRSLPEKLLTPLIPFFHFTFFPARLFAMPADRPERTVDDHLVLVRGAHREAPDTEAEMGSAVLNGRFLVTRSTPGRALPRVLDIVSSDVLETIGAGFVRRALFALLLLVLFVVPWLAALPTLNRAWLMAAAIGLFLRLRSAVRTGEPVGLVLLHPIAVVAMAWAILAVESKPARGADPTDPT